MSHDSRRVITRRDLLRGVGAVGAAAVGAPAALIGDATGTAPAGEAAQTPTGAQAPVGREVLEHLTAAEADTLEAMVARISRADDSGPGATEARAAHYIDRALGGALASRGDVPQGLSGAGSVWRARPGSASFARAISRRSGRGPARHRDECRHGFCRAPRRFSTWFGPIRFRARSAIRTTAATRTSSAGT